MKFIALSLAVLDPDVRVWPWDGTLYGSQWSLLQQNFPSEDLSGKYYSDQEATVVTFKDLMRHLWLKQVA